jgi:hypothetical protein
MDFKDLKRKWYLWSKRSLRRQISTWENDGGYNCKFEDFVLVNGRLERGLLAKIKASFYRLFGSPPKQQRR